MAKKRYEHKRALGDIARQAGYIAQNGAEFNGGGGSSAALRMRKAKMKIVQLTRAGVRINPKTATKFTRDAMAKAASPSGRLDKLSFRLGIRKLDK